MPLPFRSRLASVVLLTAFVFVAASCGDDAGPEDSIVFGQGSIPSTFPSDFPVPGGAVIGSTLIDRVNNRSEARLTMRSDLVASVQFFQVGLVNQGYVVERSEGDSGSWHIEFVRGELRGEITLILDSGVSSVFVRINTS
jgi:hypothetical protein